jgi:hypothetical protein
MHPVRWNVLVLGIGIKIQWEIDLRWNGEGSLIILEASGGNEKEGELSESALLCIAHL